MKWGDSEMCSQMVCLAGLTWRMCLAMIVMKRYVTLVYYVTVIIIFGAPIEVMTSHDLQYHGYWCTTK